jgi:hypothetical protein
MKITIPSKPKTRLSSQRTCSYLRLQLQIPTQRPRTHRIRVATHIEILHLKLTFLIASPPLTSEKTSEAQQVQQHSRAFNRGRIGPMTVRAPSLLTLCSEDENAKFGFIKFCFEGTVSSLSWFFEVEEED